MAHNKGIMGQSEAAQNARLDRGCCPIHGLGMSQMAGWWYPLDGPSFTLVECPRGDCDVICKASGPTKILGAPLTEAEVDELPDPHGFTGQIGEFVHFMRGMVLRDLRKQRDAGKLSADDYATVERNADVLLTIARTFVAALDATKESAQ